MAAINSFLRVVPESELSKRERDAALKKAEEENNKPLMTGLAAYVTKCWEAAKTAKEPITDRLLKAQRARMGKYDPELLAEIKAFGGSEEYARITDNKCRIAESWLRDIFLGQTEKPWTIKPTPSPSMPPDMVASVRSVVGSQIAQYFAISGQMPSPADVRALTEKLRDAELQKLNQTARDISNRMERKMEDQLAEGGWHTAFGQFIADLVTYPSAHFKAPVLRKKSSLKWVQEGANWVPQVQDEIMPVFERVDPFKIFPAPGITNPQDGYMIEWLEFTRDDIYNLIGVPGFSEDAIRAVIDQYGANGLKNWTGLNTLVEQSDINDQQVRVDSPAVFIDCLEFSGPVRGKDLLEWGMDEKDIPDEDKDYEASVWLIGRWVIKAQINPDPLKRRPYYKTSYEEVPGSYWGLGLPDLLEDVQGVANAAVRSLVNNMGMCLTGDTVVYRHERKGGKKKRKYGGRAGAEVTLSQLWAQKHTHNSGLRRNVLRSLDEESGEFFGNRVVNIYHNGVQPVYRVTTRHGYSIKATMAHRFMADSGEYKHLQNFAVGDSIAVNGRESKALPTCVDCGKGLKKPTAVRCHSCASKVSAWNIKQAEDALLNKMARGTTARARKLVRAQMKDCCEVCSATDRLHIHHVDKDPMNCHPANLMTLCEPCHNDWHARHDNYGNPFLHSFVDYDTIIAIEYVGEAEVFDLEMTAPNHNFVANGFISHNCSGPQVGINVDRLPPGEDLTNLHPWKIWQFQDSQVGANTPPMEFFQPQSNVNELLTVVDKFYQFADDFSMVPRYLGGSADIAGGVGRTASGMSMIMNAANKGMKGVVSNVDLAVMTPMLESLYNFNMLFSDDQTIKGDSQVIARGAVSLMQLESLQLRRNEFLQATANPVDAQIVGPQGRATILREVAKGLEMDVNEIVPPAEVLAKQQQQQMMQAQGTPPAPNREMLQTGQATTDNFSPT